MNPKRNRHFGHFFIQMWPCEVQLPSFLQGKERIFVNLNANILQSTQWEFLKFFPHLSKPLYYEILQLHVSKNGFFLKLGTCAQNDSFWAFGGKYSQRTLEVNLLLYKILVTLPNIEICFTLPRICYWKFEGETLYLLSPWGVKATPWAHVRKFKREKKFHS